MQGLSFHAAKLEKLIVKFTKKEYKINIARNS